MVQEMKHFYHLMYSQIVHMMNVTRWTFTREDGMFLQCFVVCVFCQVYSGTLGDQPRRLPGLFITGRTMWLIWCQLGVALHFVLPWHHLLGLWMWKVSVKAVFQNQSQRNMRRKCNCYIALTRFWTRTFQNTGTCIKGMPTYPPTFGKYVPSVIFSKEYVCPLEINYQWFMSPSESPPPLKNVVIFISEVCISVKFSAYVLTTKYRGKLK